MNVSHVSKTTQASFDFEIFSPWLNTVPGGNILVMLLQFVCPYKFHFEVNFEIYLKSKNCVLLSLIAY